jgi:DNA polymerase III epsilon subunit-like protein
MLFAVFDTETTGLPLHPQADLSLQNRVIEFGGIITDGVEIFNEVSFRVNPEVKLHQIITDITGLTNADLDNEPTFEHHVDTIRQYFAIARGCVAHNLSFDKGVLQFDLRRCGKTLVDIDWPPIEVCTVEETYQKYGKRKKLKDLYAELVGDQTQEHRALSDVMMLHAVAKEIGLYEAFND